ncbi:hypothetical protein B9K06_13255 [Bacillus sp. OG2]|nr:hypothetical protein B9K06_13255 [Bacillus sp. OG2]
MRLVIFRGLYSIGAVPDAVESRLIPGAHDCLELPSAGFCQIWMRFRTKGQIFEAALENSAEFFYCSI